MRTFFLLLSLVVVFACSEQKEAKKEEPVKKLEPKPGEKIFDCRDYLDTNIATCIKGLVARLQGDSVIASEYCKCIFEEMMNRYTCEQIMQIKDMSPENQQKIYEPIKQKCYDLYMKKAMEEKAQKKKMENDTSIKQ